MSGERQAERGEWVRRGAGANCGTDWRRGAGVKCGMDWCVLEREECTDTAGEAIRDGGEL